MMDQPVFSIMADAAGSSAELASLGDAFGHGVELYSESNQALMTTLTRIEGALDGATQRSDEQLGYYVAQAREIIDQSMLSQREIIDDLRRLGETSNLRARLLSRLLEEVFSQFGYILGSLAKRRQSDVYPLDPEVKVLPEMSKLNLFLQVTIGGTNNSNIHLNRLNTSQTDKLISLRNCFPH